jgi:NLI interacting factor-like phosphatase
VGFDMFATLGITEYMPIPATKKLLLLTYRFKMQPNFIILVCAAVHASPVKSTGAPTVEAKAQTSYDQLFARLVTELPSTLTMKKESSLGSAALQRQESQQFWIEAFPSSQLQVIPYYGPPVFFFDQLRSNVAFTVKYKRQMPKDNFDALMRQRKLLPYSSNARYKSTLVMELQDVLVQCRAGLSYYDFTYHKESGEHVGCVMRPGYVHFIKWAAKNYELVIWSSLDEADVGTIMEFIDTKLQELGLSIAFTAALSRKDCHLVDGKYIKNMATLGRDRDSIVALGTDFTAHIFNLCNLMLIEPFNGDANDRGLSVAASRLFLLRERKVGGYSKSVKDDLAEMFRLRSQMHYYIESLSI